MCHYSLAVSLTFVSQKTFFFMATLYRLTAGSMPTRDQPRGARMLQNESINMYLQESGQNRASQCVLAGKEQLSMGMGQSRIFPHLPRLAPKIGPRPSQKWPVVLATLVALDSGTWDGQGMCVEYVRAPAPERHEKEPRFFCLRVSSFCPIRMVFGSLEPSYPRLSYATLREWIGRLSHVL